MKKLVFILLLSLFAFVACQKDEERTEIEAVNIDDTELKRVQNDAYILELLENIPEKFKENPEAYVNSLFSTDAKDATDDDCLIFAGGYVFIRPGCSITSGIPPEYRDCNTTDVIYMGCAFDPINFCFICLVEYTVRCEDGEEITFVGYDIRCLSRDPAPVQP